MAEVKFHIKLPIFIMRQLVRHRTANLNEYSARYSVLSDEFYLPEPDYLQPQSTTNKQGRDGDYNGNQKLWLTNMLTDSYDKSYETYSYLLNEEGSHDYIPGVPGLSRELARMVVPVANYTECYWKCDLHNLFHFLRLRMDSHAQREIRDFATAMYNLVKEKFPLSCEAFEDYRFHAKTLSRMDLNAIKDMLTGNFVADHNHYGMSKREYTELLDSFGPTVLNSWRSLRTE